MQDINEGKQNICVGYNFCIHGTHSHLSFWYNLV